MRSYEITGTETSVIWWQNAFCELSCQKQCIVSPTFRPHISVKFEHKRKLRVFMNFSEAELRSFFDKRPFTQKTSPLRFFQDTHSARAPVLAFRSSANLRIALHSSRGVSLCSVLFLYIRFIVFEVQACKIIHNFANFAKFRYSPAVATALAR